MRRLPQVSARSRVWFNPDLYSRNYFVPGVVANIIMLVTLMLTALAIVREKEIGTMEQLMVTPVRPIELMLGKTLPFALVGLLDVVLITAAALLVFPHSVARQRAAAAVLRSVLFLMTTLGAGLFLSTISQTQQQAMMAIVLLLHAGVHAERVCVSDPEYAGGGAVADVPESGAVFHGDRARDVSEGARDSKCCGRRWRRWRCTGWRCCG